MIVREFYYPNFNKSVRPSAMGLIIIVLLEVMKQENNCEAIKGFMPSDTFTLVWMSLLTQTLCGTIKRPFTTRVTFFMALSGSQFYEAIFAMNLFIQKVLKREGQLGDKLKPLSV